VTLFAQSISRVNWVIGLVQVRNKYEMSKSLLCKNVPCPDKQSKTLLHYYTVQCVSNYLL